MRIDRLTNQLQVALSDAQSLAIGRDNQFIEPAHLLLALLDQQGGSIRPLVQQSGANVQALRSALTEQVDKLPKVTGQGDVHMSNDLMRLLNVAEILRTPVNTVRWWRQEGTGPEFFKIGRRLYTTVGDLRTFIRGQRLASQPVLGKPKAV